MHFAVYSLYYDLKIRKDWNLSSEQTCKTLNANWLYSRLIEPKLIVLLILLFSGFSMLIFWK